MKKVVVFTSPSCRWCSVVKNHLKKNNIKFKTIDITKDDYAAADCQLHGCKGVPVVLIGSKWICGFDEQKIQKALK